MDFFFEPMNFIENLKYMGVGMLGIFIVIGLIMVVVMLLNKFIRPKNK
ncbi:MAG: oxaloacetate decarboxylase [Clostridia bacterium]|nr:oxaloacetate decarboxylase [Clostridia bacterium]